MSTYAAPETAKGTEKLLGAGLVVLGSLIAVCVVLGPFLLDDLVYRTSPTARNQIIGSDAVGLLVVAPLSVALGLLVFRGHRRLAFLGLAPSLFAAYTYPQLIIGNEYAARSGNVERFFPLLLCVFVVASGVFLGSWMLAPAEPAPATTRRGDVVTGIALLVIAAFIAIGLHLPTYLDALSTHPTNQGSLTAPTAFWLVKFMDLGIVVPIAVAVGLGMLRHRPWARRPTYAILGGYTLLAASVAAMAAMMYLKGDPDRSLGTLIAAIVAAGALATLTGHLYRSLFSVSPSNPQKGRRR